MNMYARQAMAPIISAARPQTTRTPGDHAPATPPTTRNPKTIARNCGHRAHASRRSQSKKPFRMPPLTTRPTPRKTQPISPIWFRTPAANPSPASVAKSTYDE